MRKIFPVEELARDDRFVRVQMIERMNDGRSVSGKDGKGRGPQRLTPEEIARELRAYAIDYLVVFPDCPIKPSSSVLANPIRARDLASPRVYKLDH